MAVTSIDNAPKTNVMATVHIGKYSVGHLLKLAKQLAEVKSANTRVFDEKAEARVPTFDKSGKFS